MIDTGSKQTKCILLITTRIAIAHINKTKIIKNTRRKKTQQKISQFNAGMNNLYNNYFMVILHTDCWKNLHLGGFTAACFSRNKNHLVRNTGEPNWYQKKVKEIVWWPGKVYNAWRRKQQWSVTEKFCCPLIFCLEPRIIRIETVI